MTTAIATRKRGGTPPAPPEVVDRATAYARDVAEGRVVAGELVRLACRRHLDDLLTGPARGLRWDVGEAEAAIEFFGFLRHSKGRWAGSLFALEPWQCFIVGSLWGWRRARSGLRRFTEAYNEMARKQGKSTLAAGVALRATFFDSPVEAGAEGYVAATKREQAKIVWSEVERMVKASPDLSARLNVWRSSDTVSWEARHCLFRPLGRDKDSIDGLNTHLAIIDEYHAHKTDELMELLRTSTGSREQPLIFTITTPGVSRESPCWRERDHAVRVLRGVVADDSKFAYVATLDEADAWDDPVAWVKANPNLGVSVTVEDLQDDCEKAKANPSRMNWFKRMKCALWTSGASSWIPVEDWNAQPAPRGWDAMGESWASSWRDVVASVAGEESWLGVDLASTSDITALILLVPEGRDAIDVYAWFFVPEGSVERHIESRQVPYDVWIEQGWIEAIPGPVMDYRVMQERMNEIASIVRVRTAGIDRWNSSDLQRMLDEDGWVTQAADAKESERRGEDQERWLVQVPQTMQRHGPPTKALERLVALGTEGGGELRLGVRHGNNPVLRWMLSNVVIREDSDENRMPDRKKSTEKIDGVKALLNALAEWMVVTPVEEDGPVAFFPGRGAIGGNKKGGGGQ